MSIEDFEAELTVFYKNRSRILFIIKYFNIFSFLIIIQD